MELKNVQNPIDLELASQNQEWAHCQWFDMCSHSIKKLVTIDKTEKLLKTACMLSPRKLIFQTLDLEGDYPISSAIGQVNH